MTSAPPSSPVLLSSSVLLSLSPSSSELTVAGSSTPVSKTSNWLGNEGQSGFTSELGQGSFTFVFFAAEIIGTYLISCCLSVGSVLSDSSLAAWIVGGQEQTLVTLGFLGASKCNGSLDDGAPSGSSYVCTKPGWEKVFERLRFLEEVLPKSDMLAISEMPGSLCEWSSLGDTSWSSSAGRQE